MKLYDQSQWVLIFFLYSVLGWVWETLYVSAKKRRWINRGFLFGPWLPIYGFGALIILLLTLPVRENVPAVFLLGMAGATLLEYVTGAVMERLFHVRYWDYTGLPCNLNGHISLFTSLAWGGFSLLLVRLLHPPVEQAVLRVPLWAADVLGLLLTILFVVDTTKSVQAALDLKALLKNLAGGSKRLHNLEEQLQASMKSIRQEKEAVREKLQGLQTAVHALETELAARRRKEYQRAVSLLRRNPSAVSRRHRGALRELFDLKTEENGHRAEYKNTAGQGQPKTDKAPSGKDCPSGKVGPSGKGSKGIQK